MLPPSHPGQSGLNQNERLTETDIVRELLAADGISIALQPIVTLSKPTIVGWESLVRGTHPTLGVIPPMMLVDAALQSGHLDELTIRVADLAIDALDRAYQIVKQPLRVTINIEIEQCYLGNAFLDWLLARKLPEGVLITIEVTERGSDEWSAANERAAQALELHGIDIGLDDVGAGASRIGFFRSRRWDLIKIDQTFLTRETDRARQVIERFVQMIHGLELPSLAEGIETVEHLVFAQKLGIMYGQGYWLGMPGTVEQTLEALRDHGLDIEGTF